MAQLFQIVQGSPRLCPIRDGIIGSDYRILPMTYHREDYAVKLAGFLGQRNYDQCGDDWFYVIRAGEKALNRMGRENRVSDTYKFRDADGIANDEMPF